MAEAERSRTEESKPERGSGKPEQTEAHCNPYTALWTMLSGFESLPASHISFCDNNFRIESVRSKSLPPNVLSPFSDSDLHSSRSARLLYVSGFLI